MISKPSLFLMLAACALVGVGARAAEGPVKVEIRGEPGAYQLYRAGEPYVIRGAGTALVENLDALKQHGGNSVRTWHTGEGEMLDAAHELGMTVSLCLDIMRERHGFDYDDPAAVRVQLEKVKAEVLKYRDHPALLTWIIGNELNHDYSNPRVYDAVNELAQMIHQIDPNHPVTTTTSGFSAELAEVIMKRAPDIDFLSVQVYGGLFDLRKTLAEIDLDKTLMVTEWGTVGHWEVEQTAWGAPIEPTSSIKAGLYRRGYETILEPLEGSLIGNYVFLWGQKQERTPTWYGMLTTDGLQTETMDVMQHIWTEAWPENRAPEIREFTLNGYGVKEDVTLQANSAYRATISALDTDGDTLSYSWQLLAESDATEGGGDEEEVPEDFSKLLSNLAGDSVLLNTRTEPGAYRLFVYVHDGKGNAGHANFPFLVVPEDNIPKS